MNVSLSPEDRRRRIAQLLGYAPDRPQSWPAASIESLLELEDRKGERALHEAIRRMLPRNHARRTVPG
jgi:hypothetical protein